MRREPSRPGTRPRQVAPRAGLPGRGLPGRGLPGRGLLAVALALTGGHLGVGCGAAPPAAFRPRVSPPRWPREPGGRDSRTGRAGRAQRTGGPLDWPPFGSNVHIVMSGWRPADPGEVPWSSRPRTSCSPSSTRSTGKTGRPLDRLRFRPRARRPESQSQPAQRDHGIVHRHYRLLPPAGVPRPGRRAPLTCPSASTTRGRGIPTWRPAGSSPTGSPPTSITI